MAVLKDPGYDPIADFTPIARLTVNSQVLAVSAKLNVHSVAELVALAKSSPEPLTFASAGKGTIAHLGGEYLKLQTGVEMTHIPYSDSQLMVDLISGRTSMIVYPYLALKGPIDGKQVIPLAVLDEKRPSWLPNVPTMAELGYPKMVLQSWFALFGPANLPADIVGKLTNAFRQALADPATQATLASTGSNPAYAGPDELKAFNRAEIDRFKDIVTAAHLSFDQ
jgi:tripartite-type tricarboxylate transporter receptor subunit TctC